MAEVRKAAREDIPAILNLLSRLNPDISTIQWQKCFRSEFGGDVLPGVVIDDDGVIGAFLGTNMVNRSFKNWNYTSCNIWGWVVGPAYRAQSLQMLTEVLRWDCVFTCYSPMELTHRILVKFGLVEIQRNYCITSKPGSLFYSGVKIKPLSFPDKKFSDDENSIIRYHSGLPCNIVALEKGGRHVTLVFKAEKAMSKFFSRLEALPIIGKLVNPVYMKLDYVSDEDLFLQLFRKARLKLMLRLKTIGFIIPGDLMLKLDSGTFRPYAGKRKYLWKPHTGIPPGFKADTLFSELLILGLPG